MANSTERRDLKKAAFWRRMIDRHMDSGLSVRAWCRKQGLSEARFYWWRRGLARHDSARKSSARRDAKRKLSVRLDAENPSRSFVPVHVTEDGLRDTDQRIEIVLTDGRCVRVTGSVDRRMLAEVLDVLERRAC